MTYVSAMALAAKVGHFIEMAVYATGWMAFFCWALVARWLPERPGEG